MMALFAIAGLLVLIGACIVLAGALIKNVKPADFISSLFALAVMAMAIVIIDLFLSYVAPKL